MPEETKETSFLDSEGLGIKNLRAKLITKAYKYNNTGEKAKEVVDIIGDYPWVNDTVNTSGDREETSESGDGKNITRTTWSKHNNVPYCYIVERESAMNASFANVLQLINSISAGVERGASVLQNAVSKMWSSSEKNATTTTTEDNEEDSENRS
jgi:hypothetical protein